MTPDRITNVSKLTPTKLQGWASTQRQNVLNMPAARFHAQIERKRVDAYIEPLFLAHGFRDEDGQLLTKSKDLYRCPDDAGSAAFYVECDAAHRAHGFTGPAEYCPALVAENAAIQTENIVMVAAEKLLGFEMHSLEHRAQLLDLVVAMVEGR